MLHPAFSHSTFSALTCSATSVTRLSESSPAIGSGTIAVTLPSMTTQAPPWVSSMTRHHRDEAKSVLVELVLPGFRWLQPHGDMTERDSGQLGLDRVGDHGPGRQWRRESDLFRQLYGVVGRIRIAIA